MKVRTFDHYPTKAEAVRAVEKLAHVGKKAYVAGDDNVWVVAVYRE